MASSSSSESADITVLTWNINGLKEKLKDSKKTTELLKIFDQNDIVLLQETHIGKMDISNYGNKNRTLINCTLSEKYDFVKLEDEEKKKKKKKEKKTMYVTNFHPRMKGVAIIVNKPHTLLKSFSKGGDFAWVHVEIDGQEYTFVSVYYHKTYPHLICNLMLEIFHSFLTEGLNAFKCRLVIGGDFNTTLNPDLDLYKEKKQKLIEENKEHAARRKRLNEFLRIVKLSDVWRKKHPKDRQYTYHTGTESRLDYVFMLEDDVKYVDSCAIDNDIALSDHSPVSLTLKSTGI